MHRYFSSMILALVVLAAGTALSGCASGSVSEQPVAKPIANQPQGDQPDAPQRQLSQLVSPNYAREQFAVYDPLEPVNRRLYTFNAGFDDYVFLPIVHGYDYVVPTFVRDRVHDFFLNLGEFTTFTNSVLQASPSKAGATLGRFVINSTIGVAGLFDVATPIGIDRRNEDFGQTLGYWGVAPGPYLVLPILGPSNLRDTVGLIVDNVAFNYVLPEGIRDSVPYYAVEYVVNPIDKRDHTDFRYYESGSPFEYELVRYVTEENRELMIQK